MPPPVRPLPPGLAWFLVLVLALPGVTWADAPAAGAATNQGVVSSGSPEDDGKPTAPARPKLTLPELIRLARQRSPFVANAASQIEIRRWQRREARWSWFPTGDVTFGITFSTGVQCKDENGNPSLVNCVRTVDAAGQNLSIPLVKNNVSGSAGELAVRLNQPIYTSGKIETSTRAAEAGILAEEARTEGARFDAELSAARAYWGLKAARTALVTARDTRQQVVDWIDRIERDMDADKPKYNFSQTDLARIKVALATIDTVVADLERNQTIGEHGVRLATASDVDIDDEELDRQEVIEQPLDYYQREAALHRPEVRALAHGSTALRHLVRFQLTQMLPNFGLQIAIGNKWAQDVAVPPNAFFNQPNSGPYYGAVLGAQQPLDLFVRYTRFARARAEADAFDAQRKLAEAGIALEITQAFANLEEARKRSRTLERAVHVAQGWLHQIEQRMDLGVGDDAGLARDFVEAARNHFELRLRFFQSINDVNYGIAQLRRATGVDVAR